MKRVLVVIAALSVVSLAAAQYTSPQSGTQGSTPQTQPSTSGSGQQQGAQGSQAQGQAQPGQAQPGAPGQPAGKRPPQAKSQEEFNAYKTAAAITDPAGLEKAATDFAAKFPDSELRVLLLKQSMSVYQNANNADKTAEIGRKVLAIDPDDPQSLISVSEVISERTRTTDLDFNEKTGEATKLAQHALQTIDTDLMFAPNAPPEKVKEAKDWLRATAYAILGNINMEKNDYASAERDLKQAIELTKAQPDPVNFLRLAVALDKQNKYADALVAANKAVELAPETTQVGTLARQERDRLKQLTGGGATPSPSASTPANPPNAPATQPSTPQPHP